MKQNSINSEQGSISALCMLTSIGLVLCIQEFWPELEKSFNLPTKIVLLSLAGFFVTGTILTGFVDIFVSERSPRQLKKIIVKERKKLIQTLIQAKEDLAELEGSIKYTSNIMSPKGFEELQTLRGLIASLESRISRVNKLLTTRIPNNVYVAYNTMFDDVSVYGPSLDGLILADSDTNFSYDYIKKELETRLELVKSCLSLVQRDRRARANTL